MVREGRIVTHWKRKMIRERKIFHMEIEKWSKEEDMLIYKYIISPGKRKMY